MNRDKIRNGGTTNENPASQVEVLGLDLLVLLARSGWGPPD